MKRLAILLVGPLVLLLLLLHGDLAVAVLRGLCWRLQQQGLLLREIRLWRGAVGRREDGGLRQRWRGVVGNAALLLLSLIGLRSGAYDAAVHCDVRQSK